MKTIGFTKVVASGNDFVVIENSPQSAVRSPQKMVKIMCNRKYGVGADGLLVLDKSKIAEVKMRIFNADGSEAEMCGNGARCAALYYSRRAARPSSRQKRLKIETRAGVIAAEVSGDNVKIKLTEPKGYKADIPLIINSRTLRVDFINTGVPHAVIFVEKADDIDVYGIGRKVRYHERFASAGTNADFVETIDKNTIKVRTYERGVEGETLACGTGAAACALVYALKSATGNKINVRTQGKEMLRVYFKKHGNRFSNVWLEGKVRLIFSGRFVHYIETGGA